MIRHRPNYHRDYKKRMIEDAIKHYGDRCSCVGCVLPKGHRPLIMTTKEKISQGQYGISLYVKRNGYKKGLVELKCPDCLDGCDHSYVKSLSISEKSKKVRGYEWWQRKLWLSAKRKSDKMKCSFEIKENDIVIPSTCPVLGVKITKKMGEGFQLFNPEISRIDQKKGFTRKNTVIVSVVASMVMSNPPPHSTVEYIKRLFLSVSRRI